MLACWRKTGVDATTHAAKGGKRNFSEDSYLRRSTFQAKTDFEERRKRNLTEQTIANTRVLR